MTKSRLVRALAGISLGVLLPSAFAASHSVTYGHNAYDLIETLIPSGSGITVVGVPTLTGYNSGGVENYGQFAAATSLSGIPFSSGVILANGDILNSIGPNDNFGVSSSLGAAGSSLLPGTTADAATLTFQFISASSSFSFQYMFASEEYNAFFTSEYNDPFAIILNGPGASDLNLARVPFTSTDVSIANVNSTSNSSYYYDNDGDGGGFDIQYNGLAGSLGSDPLYAVGEVTPGEIYTLSIVIADANDDAFDSALFLGAGTFLAEGYEGTPVPEPATWLSGLALAALILRRTRQ